MYHFIYIEKLSLRKVAESIVISKKERVIIRPPADKYIENLKSYRNWDPNLFELEIMFKQHTERSSVLTRIYIEVKQWVNDS